MPLRDHFHPPLCTRKNWEGFHGLWPGLITVALNQQLPARFEAEPNIHLGNSVEETAQVDDESALISTGEQAYAVTLPTLAVETELLTDAEYEVRIFDHHRNRRLVAAIEIVSPANKDRPESRRVFVSKCHQLLRQGVSVSIIDIVTTRHFNLYSDLLDLLGQTDPTFESNTPTTYAAACRWIPRGQRHVLETWSFACHLGENLPTIPLWLTDKIAIPLSLETTYEQTCQALRIPAASE